MVLQKQPFRLYNEYERGNNKQDVVSLKFNEKERELLEKCKKTLNLDRDGTVIKALMRSGSEVLLDKKLTPFFKIFLRIKGKGQEIDM